MFIAVLFILGNNWKQFKCPSLSEWVNKPWYFYKSEFCSEQKKEYMQQLGWMSRVMCCVHKANFKRLHVVLFHIYNILDMTKL